MAADRDKTENGKGRLLLLGHRGTRIYAPENTFAAFDRALEDGCDGFECDVRLTADGFPVICHDPRLHGHDVSRSDFATLSEECAGLCPLEGVLSRYATRCFLYIELKVAGIERQLAAALLRYTPAHGYVVASFVPEILLRVHEADAEIPLGLISDKERDLEEWRQLPLDYVMPKERLVTRDLVNDLHEARKRVLVWTVNEPKRMVAMAEAGVDGIVSDDTALLCRTFRGAQLRHRVP
jgi:glycerophosphoryl diester phosphodiesterase